MKKHLFINGEWVEGTTYNDLLSPYNGEKIAEVPVATRDEVDHAIMAAHGAVPMMTALPLHKRAHILERVCQLLEERKEEAAMIIATEAAKPIATAREEVIRTYQTYKFAAEEAKRIHGEIIPMGAVPNGDGRIAYTLREPIGVIGAITPFNFPMNLVAHKVGPAIAAGNTVVLKPARQTPLSALFIAKLFEEAGLPKGALNVVTGNGNTIGTRIVKDPRVQMVTFTGSPAVGKSIHHLAGLKKVTLELGSNSGVIIDRDVDISNIITRCVTGAFSYQGQVCISLQRIYVHKEVYDAFVERFVEETKKLKIGNPLDADVHLSALISTKDVERSLEWIEEAKSHGAKVVAGGYAEGNMLYPTVLVDVPSQAKVSCQEAFAPIVLINRVSSIEDAIQCVNDSQFGLQAGIYTNNIRTAMNAANELKVGGVMINDIPTYRVDHMPYGGVKESGTGREGVKYAIEEMTEMKLIVINNNY
ncbi:aldehyde dehydrogenase family protein [Priestia taiwanensis]|uniref:Aldehyde dehydrogenase n=1 Tax=Priestia taiwanensis TaxID=1347902 RepID=A0A917EK59_9BACI|nr:aldehyde dehydrogenase family protein [Priestia taiwanensis]MBM7361425.1 acyl-CoA reductase-like NAD-dependent aldehyde dehydrogenase [Priestia taiwanensis]GGE54037.1 aldehyde dehydrogenase [Priestia taiwanensis]